MKLFLTLLILTYSLNAQVKLESENNHSNINFSIGVAGFTKVTGKFNNYKVNLIYNKKKFTKTVVEVEIDISSIDTGIKDRDEELKGEQFFNVKKYPTISFISSEIESTKKKNHYIVYGLLSIRGIEKEVSFPFSIAKIEKNTIGINLIGKINRQDFQVGTTWKHSVVENFISDIVDFEINMWTKKAKKKKKKKDTKKDLLKKGKKLLEKELKKNF